MDLSTNLFDYTKKRGYTYYNLIKDAGVLLSTPGICLEDLSMNILVANDDGIHAQGLYELVKALSTVKDTKVYVFAPQEQRSAASQSISLRSAVGVYPVEFDFAEKAFATTGTPADCVVVGLRVLRDMGIHIDMVYSGINHGSNVGTDTLYSGTVGAAMEGLVQGYPSVAVSVDSHDAEHFQYACELAVDVMTKTDGGWEENIIININTPNLPPEAIKGVRYTTIGDREYENDIRLEKTEGGKDWYKYGGDPIKYEDESEDLDVIAIQNGYASISVLQPDLSAYEHMLKLKEWRIGK